MAAETGYVEAVNKIIIAGYGASVEKEAEEASMMPGMLVKTGTAAHQVKMGTEATANYGWLGYENSPTMWKPKDIDTAYAINARVSVISGPGMVLRAKRKANETITVGKKLVGSDVAGHLMMWTPVDGAGTDVEEMVVAIAMEDASGAEAGNVIVRSLI